MAYNQNNQNRCGGGDMSYDRYDPDSMNGMNAMQQEEEEEYDRRERENLLNHSLVSSMMSSSSSNNYLATTTFLSFVVHFKRRCTVSKCKGSRAAVANSTVFHSKLSKSGDIRSICMA